MKTTLLLLAVICLFGLILDTQAEVPKLMNYQGKLTTPEGASLDTMVSMQFSIYSDSTGGNPLWIETQLSVKVDKGIFNVLLGSAYEIPESVFTGAIRYLGVKVGADPEMSPRKPIISVGYAYNSEMLNGRNAGNGDSNIPVNNGSLNVNLNADYLDGYDAQALLSPVKQVLRDTMWVGPDVSNPRTKELSTSIDPNKSIVLLGQPYWNDNTGCEMAFYHLLQLTSTTITIWQSCTVYGAAFVIDYQIIEYK